MINYEVDADGIATVEWDLPGRAQNVMNSESTGAWIAAMDRALADPAVKGIVVTSGKKDFMAGGDLEQLLQMQSAQEVFTWSEGFHAACRRFETGAKPVACALPGSALGGGLEVAMVCHYRVAADNPKARFGLPEVTLGLLPGGGGTQRLPRLMGYAAATPLLAEGKRISAADALQKGLLHAVVPAGTERAAAKAWLQSEAARNARQPWDQKTFKMPGGGVGTPAGAMFFTAANAMLREKTYNNYPAPRHILSCLFEGLSTNIDTGLKIEARYFAACVANPEAKNMIRSLFFGVQDANKLARRPAGVPRQTYQRIGVLGAGMMGAGIALCAAQAGLDVVLLDTSAEAAAKGKDYACQQWTRQAEKGRLRADQAAVYAARIHPGADYAALQGCELVIEAVFEKRELKAQVTQQAEAVLGPDALLASNTSTLPISGLALASQRAGNFIGLHFFSPAEKMPLVEIIMGAQTTQAALARAMDFVQAIGKTPIVVNDARGFYTSRVFGTYVNEGMALLEEGVLPALIDKAGLISGMPVGPLALADEVALDLVAKIAQQTQADLGTAYQPTASQRVSQPMVSSLERVGKKGGKGFYDYPPDGKKRIWPGLASHFLSLPEAQQPSVAALVERLIMIQSIEAVRCLEEGVLQAAIDADVGAILGWGYPAFRGGPLGWLHTLGLPKALATCERLELAHGSRFAAPQRLRQMAQQGQTFF